MFPFRGTYPFPSLHSLSDALHRVYWVWRNSMHDCQFMLMLDYLGDDTPRDRAAELRVLGFSRRHLDNVQMTTDTGPWCDEARRRRLRSVSFTRWKKRRRMDFFVLAAPLPLSVASNQFFSPSSQNYGTRRSASSSMCTKASKFPSMPNDDRHNMTEDRPMALCRPWIGFPSQAAAGRLAAR